MSLPIYKRIYLNIDDVNRYTLRVLDKSIPLVEYIHTNKSSHIRPNIVTSGSEAMHYIFICNALGKLFSLVLFLLWWFFRLCFMAHRKEKIITKRYI